MLLLYIYFPAYHRAVEEWQKSIVLDFIDFKKAFDRVHQADVKNSRVARKSKQDSQQHEEYLRCLGELREGESGTH